jgi:hypothetical protein
MRAAQRAVLDAELAFPARIKIAVPPDGLGQRFDAMQRWLDDNAGADGWAMTPAGTRGVMNDAVAIYFVDATLAGAFVARWCAANRVEVREGVFRVREDAPKARLPAPLIRRHSSLSAAQASAAPSSGGPLSFDNLQNIR